MIRFTIYLSVAAAAAACVGDAESREHPDGRTDGASFPAHPSRAVPEGAREIPAGTVLTFEVLESVSTSSHAAGDVFPLLLLYAATGPLGAVLAPGTRAQGLVTDALEGVGFDRPALLAMRVASVEAGGSQRPIEGQVQALMIDGPSQPRSATSWAGTTIGIGVALTNREGAATLARGSRVVVRLGRSLVY